MPDDWKCPMCGAAKSDFTLQDEPTKNAGELRSLVGTPVFATSDLSEKNDLQKLTPGQLSALCSNLARGCEKQYKKEESELFKQHADYFKSITPDVEDATVLSVSKRLKEELDFYPEMKETAVSAGDRGTQRVCVWGEKVTKMLSSLVGRYLNEDEKMLADTQIWLCTVCGFVYIGENPPELCPVCKVPAWKFEKINAN